MLVLMENAAEAITSVDAQLAELVRVGDRFGQRCEGAGVRDPLMRSVKVIEPFILSQGM